ncbi:hypothetical protein D910_03180 [Dendroctonus ponderosae]|uniref:Uncharacterized protein n=1 Tax=Dendroctonus ponderosae TaxID=77166 RepID=U4U729_DENPD|nr:hypothetical protein D910_03180 [Dendroctonus ponderosae]
MLVLFKLQEKITYCLETGVKFLKFLSTIVLQKPPLKREDSFLKRFSTRQIPEAQETVEDTGSEGCAGKVTIDQRQEEDESAYDNRVV